ncbi:MAG: 4Fe-4S dicluster domain-containing protein [Kiritimatiellae bacterium]|nr:4Fe-4S dicluster domain-containing protein [Kiritimatiellia bacterium]
MKLPCLLQVRILKLALTSLFTRPYTTRFPKEAFEPIEEFRGRPRYDKDACIGCGACAEVCPSGCIELVDDADAAPPARRLTHYMDRCICCGQCERYCTTEKGITLTNEYDFAGFDPSDFEESVEKELLLCESCGCVIAPKDQVRWLARRLGPLAFTNPTLMLAAYDQLAVVDPDAAPADDERQRSQRVSMQCPRCRRKTVFVM